MEWWVRKKTISSKKTEKAANHCFAAFLIYHIEFVDHCFATQLLVLWFLIYFLKHPNIMRAVVRSMC